MSSRPCCCENSEFMSCREGLMSPQTETKASVGFKAGVKD